MGVDMNDTERMFFYCVFALFIFLFIWFIRSLFTALATKSWPNVEGVITQSEVKKHYRNKGSNQSIIYEASIKYDYKINNEAYSANRISYHNVRGGRPHAERMVSKYKKGNTVKVYYKSDKPKLAVLEPGIEKASVFLISIFFIAGLGSMCFVLIKMN